MSTDNIQNQKFRKNCREYFNSLPENVKRTSLFIKYLDEKEGAKYTVGEYFQNNMGHWIGTIDGVFDFDFFEIHEVVGFLPMENVLTAIDSLNLKYVE